MIERRPFHIDRIQMWRMINVEGSRQPVKAELPTTAFEIENDPEAQVTRVQVRRSREPLTSLILQTSSRNFSRAASVRASRPIGAGDAMGRSRQRHD